jgi:hypothetical protein
MTVIHVLHEGGHWQAHLEVPDEIDAYRTVSNWAELLDFADEQGVVIGPGVLDVPDSAAFTEEFGPPPSTVRLR